MRKLICLVSVPVLLLSAPLFASGASSGSALRPSLVAAYNSQREISRDLSQGLMQKVAKKGLDIMVAEGLDMLRVSGEFSLADQLEQEWTQQLSPRLAGVSSLELGDFEPLSPWLANFYESLYTKTNGAIKGVRLLKDVWSMNYALSVAFRPNGKWRAHTSYDRIEYRKHFIPFAQVTTYWVTDLACNHYASDYKKVCGKAADLLEHLMARYVAAPISDQIFRLATGEKPSRSNYGVSPILTEDEFIDAVLDPSFQLDAETASAELVDEA